MSARFAAAVCALILLPSITLAPARAQISVGPCSRPTIGLALGGGGARGFAHIGVIEWLEEHHIPVDMIAGTSMGGLVGGMYAMGMSPGEMRALTESIDWEKTLGPGPSYADLSFRRKEDRRDLQVNLEFGLRRGVSGPSGLRSGHEVALLLDRLTVAYSEIDSFDQLPTPFRCVATDMTAGEAVVLKDGSLSQALRATMSIPGVFPPVERDGKVLADGFLLNNVPTDVLKDMGADIIIAVDIGTPLGDKESVQTLAGMVGQAWSVMTIQNVRRNLRLATVILSPDLEQYTSLDYQSSGRIADLGYAGAREKQAILAPLSVSDAEWDAIRRDRQSRLRTGTDTPLFVEVRGADAASNDAIRAKLERYAGTPLSPDVLEPELTALTVSGRYESVGYTLTRRGTKPGLLVDVQQQRSGPPFLRLGLEANGAEPDNVRLKLGSRLTLMDAGGRGSEIRTDLAAGSQYLVSTEYWRPVAGRLFVAPRLFYREDSRDLFQQGSRVAEYRVTERGAGLDAGLASGRKSEIRLGYEWLHMDAGLRVGSPVLSSMEGSVRSAVLRWQYDGRNNPVVPTGGTRSGLVARFYQAAPGAERDFLQLQGAVSTFRPLSPTRTVFAMVSGGTTFNRQAPLAQQFTLGGPFRLGAYSLDELRGNAYVVANVGYLKRIGQFSALTGMTTYAAMWLEGGGVFDGQEGDESAICLSAGLVAATPIGPAFVGASLGDSGNSNLYFVLGQVF